MQDIWKRRVAKGRCRAPSAWSPAATASRSQAVGSVDLEGSAPMARDSIFRIASITKPITAAAVMMLVDEGRIALEDPVERWLPELGSRVVVRTPGQPVDDVVPAARPITVLDLLTSRAGYGWPSDFSLPAVELLFDVQTDGREVQLRPDAGRVDRAAVAGSRCCTSRARRGCTTRARISRAS